MRNILQYPLKSEDVISTLENAKKDYMQKQIVGCVDGIGLLGYNITAATKRSEAPHPAPLFSFIILSTIVVHNSTLIYFCFQLLCFKLEIKI